MTPQATLPPTAELTYAQYSGWACCWCGTRLKHGAVSAGIARGQSGAHVLDIEVYACPNCVGDHAHRPPPDPYPVQEGTGGSSIYREDTA